MSGSLFCADAIKKPVSIRRPVFTGEIEEDKSIRNLLSTKMGFVVLMYSMESCPDIFSAGVSDDVVDGVARLFQPTPTLIHCQY